MRSAAQTSRLLLRRCRGNFGTGSAGIPAACGMPANEPARMPALPVDKPGAGKSKSLARPSPVIHTRSKVSTAALFRPSAALISLRDHKARNATGPRLGCLSQRQERFAGHGFKRPTLLWRTPPASQRKRPMRPMFRNVAGTAGMPGYPAYPHFSQQSQVVAWEHSEPADLSRVSNNGMDRPPACLPR
jgi:hypothetical protein